MPYKLLQGGIFKTPSLSTELSNANYYFVPIIQRQAYILPRGGFQKSRYDSLLRQLRKANSGIFFLLLSFI